MSAPNAANNYQLARPAFSADTEEAGFILIMDLDDEFDNLMRECATEIQQQDVAWRVAKTCFYAGIGLPLAILREGKERPEQLGSCMKELNNLSAQISCFVQNLRTGKETIS